MILFSDEVHMCMRALPTDTLQPTVSTSRGGPRGNTMSRTNQAEARTSSNPRHTDGGSYASKQRKGGVGVHGEVLVESSFHAAREATVRDEGAGQKPNIYEGTCVLLSSKHTSSVHNRILPMGGRRGSVGVGNVVECRILC